MKPFDEESLKAKKFVIAFAVILVAQSFLPDFSVTDVQAAYNENRLNPLEAKLSNQPGPSPGSVK